MVSKDAVKEGFQMGSRECNCQVSGPRSQVPRLVVRPTRCVVRPTGGTRKAFFLESVSSDHRASGERRHITSEKNAGSSPRTSGSTPANMRARSLMSSCDSALRRSRKPETVTRCAVARTCSPTERAVARTQSLHEDPLRRATNPHAAARGVEIGQPVCQVILGRASASRQVVSSGNVAS
jgi:hypothetical protein